MQGSAAIYVRISDDKLGTGAGVERQLKECRELAANLGLTVSQEYVDNDLSATSGKRRPSFEALLASKPAAIIAWHQDRLLRVTKDLERVIDLGINVYMVTAGTLDLSTPAGRAVARTVAAWTQYEGEQKAARQKARNRADKAAGLPHLGNRRFGWELDRVTLRESEAARVREATQHIVSGGTLYAAVQRLNSAGVLTSRGKAWSAQGLRQVLLRPANAGFLDDIETPSQITPLVSPDEWRSCVAVLTNPARAQKPGPKVTTLLAGLMTCPCGAGMVSASNRQRGVLVNLYRCGAQAKGNGGKHASIRRHVADDEALWQLFLVLLGSDDEPEASTDTAAPLVAQVAELTRQRAVVQELALMPGADLKDTARRLRELGADIDRLNADIEAMRTQAAGASVRAILDAAGLRPLLTSRSKPTLDLAALHADYATFREAFDALDIERRRALIRGSVSITVNHGRSAERLEVTPA